jgi:hypothetical protein
MITNKIQELILRLPAMCGARGSWGRSGELQYLDELNHPEFYSRVQGESFQDRCESYVAFVDHCTDRDKAFYGIGLLALVDANHKQNEVEAMALRDQLSSLAGTFSDVDAILPYDEAAKLLAWSPE